MNWWIVVGLLLLLLLMRRYVVARAIQRFADTTDQGFTPETIDSSESASDPYGMRAQYHDGHSAADAVSRRQAWADKGFEGAMQGAEYTEADQPSGSTGFTPIGVSFTSEPRPQKRRLDSVKRRARWAFGKHPH